MGHFNPEARRQGDAINRLLKRPPGSHMLYRGTWQPGTIKFMDGRLVDLRRERGGLYSARWHTPFRQKEEGWVTPWSEEREDWQNGLSPKKEARQEAETPIPGWQEPSQTWQERWGLAWG